MKRVLFVGLWISLCVLAACSSHKSEDDAQTLYSGNIRIAVDESLRHIMEEELQVYTALNPEAVVTPVYCSEVEAVNLLMKDSVRLAVTNRALTERELQSFHTRKFFPESVRMAVSGLALIVNRQNPDSLLTVDQFRRVLLGEVTRWEQLNPDSRLGELQLVFDNPNSGTVRFAIDSICKGQPIASAVKAQRTNEAVIRYVSETPGAIGVIWVNWIGNDAASTRLAFNQSGRVVAVSADTAETTGDACRPYQAYLALRKYPLTHDVYILINDPRGALPTGLMTFLTGDRGQRIILKSGLVPATQPVRLVDVKDDF